MLKRVKAEETTLESVKVLFYEKTADKRINSISVCYPYKRLNINKATAGTDKRPKPAKEFSK